MRRRQRGYSIIEILVSLAVFGVIVIIFSLLASEMRSHQKRLPMNFMRHPQISAVLARMRRDVQDAHGHTPYKPSFGGFEQSPQTLIIESVQPNGGIQTIIWDFSQPGVVRRRSYNVGVATDWFARGVPAEFSSELKIDAVDIPGRPWGVRIVARDQEGRIAIDQILQPRAHN